MRLSACLSLDVSLPLILNVPDWRKQNLQSRVKVSLFLSAAAQLWTSLLFGRQPSDKTFYQEPLLIQLMERCVARLDSAFKNTSKKPAVCSPISISGPKPAVSFPPPHHLLSRRPPGSTPHADMSFSSFSLLSLSSQLDTNRVKPSPDREGVK